MTDRVELAQNAAARAVPSMVNGKPQIPYLGIGKYQPRVRKQAPPVRSSKDYPENGDKRLPDLETALRKCGLRDGMVVSNHHHLRDGDKVALRMLEAAAKIGVKDLLWFPSASFPSQKSAIDLMEKGVIHHIEGSMNGPLGDYCTQGKMRGMGVPALARWPLASHSGRRSPHRHRRYRGPYRRRFRQCRRLPRQVRLRFSWLRLSRLHLRRPRHRSHR